MAKLTADQITIIKSLEIGKTLIDEEDMNEEQLQFFHTYNHCRLLNHTFAGEAIFHPKKLFRPLSELFPQVPIEEIRELESVLKLKPEIYNKCFAQQ